MTKVKVCGITNPEDAEQAMSCGADYLGMIFAPSKRTVIKGQAKLIVDNCPEYTSWVGVFMNGKKRDIEELIEGLPIGILQFHGNETPAFCNYFINRGYEVIKTIPVCEGKLGLDPGLYTKVPYFLFDTVHNGQCGGTGMTFTWDVLVQCGVKKLASRMFLGGGLSVGNVSDAIAVVHPYAVDVSSGLEREPGKKEGSLVQEFIDIVKKGTADDHKKALS